MVEGTKEQRTDLRELFRNWDDKIELLGPVDSIGLLQWGTDMYVSQNIKELLYSRIHS